ncbi:hypothetical protein [Pseudoruegeria sp. SHC-113]|uniref:hypothetical protein n=1 Tax=Pseudoruegeria sp. SHC-113 TaxID=2855439 RepID=UPI0021BB002C|nr:hypothetical protein [Pseudoruegeria sp. SHC-113]MCT8161635.1 hypothetical protein [Pseudoruegeria sp. SHC-113]
MTAPRALSCAPSGLKPLLLASGLWLSAAPVALACAFHDYVPRPGLSDELEMSETVLLARPDPASPFRFIPVIALRGVGEEVDLPQLVDSVTRRRLAANPDDHVLFLRPDDYGEWERGVYVDDQTRTLLESLVAEIAQEGFLSLERRVEIFGPLLQSEHPVLNAIALREADQLPYELMRALPPPPQAAPHIAALSTASQAQSHPIRLLLLGLSPDPAARAFLENALLAAAATGNTRNLGALTAGYIESAGAEGVVAIEAAFFTRPAGPRDIQSEALIEAMAIHSLQGDPETTAAITQAIAHLLEAHPDSIAPVARQFGGREIPIFADQAASLLERGLLDSLEMRNSAIEYVARSRRAASDAFLMD